MKKLVKAVVMLLAGAGLGGGAAYGTDKLLGPAHAAEADPDAEEEASPALIVAGGTLLAPLVLDTGRLAGYVSFDVDFEVGEEDVEYVAALQPLFAHEVNLRTYRAPLAAGPDGLLPDLENLRVVLDEAAIAAFGEDVVRRSLITKAVPA